MTHNVYRMNIVFRVPQDEDADLKRKIKEGGGKHTACMEEAKERNIRPAASGLRYEPKSRLIKDADLPHELIEYLSVAKNPQVATKITITQANQED